VVRCYDRSMIRGIDHLVIACADPDAAVAELQEGVGLQAGGGGRHEDGGTFNRLVWLADAYLELIGVGDRELALARPFGRAVVQALDERGGGLVTYALVDDDLDLTVGALHAAGSAIGPVTRGSRRRGDNELVEYWTAQPEEIGPDHVPFLIQHAYTGAEWSREAVEARAAFAHPIGSPALMVRLDLATDDPPTMAGIYAEQLGLEFWAVADLAVCTVGRHTIRLVPRREMQVPAVVTLGAEIELPRSAAALGMRFDVEYVDLRLPTPNRA
jgi:hypothetical protein